VARTGLYPEPQRLIHRATVSLDADVVSLTLPDGHTQRHPLDGCAVLIVDAAYHRRFVKMLAVERTSASRNLIDSETRLIVITPPDRGAIAPGVVRVPAAPSDAVVVETEVWDVLAAWLSGGGRLTGCSMVELARLAAIATPQFAVVIGKVAAEIAIQIVSERVGPLRGGNTFDDVLRPLYEAARRTPPAAVALTSALAHAAGMPPGRRIKQ
jgi:hypothetical protein